MTYTNRSKELRAIKESNSLTTAQLAESVPGRNVRTVEGYLQGRPVPDNIWNEVKETWNYS